MKTDLNRKISGFDEFKLVMETIGKIQSTTISIEIELHEMQETFSVLEDHKIQVLSRPLLFYLFVSIYFLFIIFGFYLFRIKDYFFVVVAYKYIGVPVRMA